MKIKHVIAIAAIGMAAPAFAQSQPMSGPNMHGAGGNPTAPMPGQGDGQGMSQGPGSNSGTGTRSDDHGSGMQNGNMGGSDRGMSDRGMGAHDIGDRGMGRGDMHRRCRTVWRHHHRVRRCM